MEKIKNNLENINIPQKICSLVEILCAEHNYEGDNPLEIKLANNNFLLSLEIRKGEDWITIQKRVSNNPSLVITYEFSKKNKKWIFLDSYKMKYGYSDSEVKQDLNLILQCLEDSVNRV